MPIRLKMAKCLSNSTTAAGIKWKKKCGSWFLPRKANCPRTPINDTNYDLSSYLYPYFSIGFSLFSSTTVVSDSFLSAEGYWSPKTADPDWRCSHFFHLEGIAGLNGKKGGAWFMCWSAISTETPLIDGVFDICLFLCPYVLIGFDLQYSILVLFDSFLTADGFWSPETADSEWRCSSSFSTGKVRLD